jgi:hypothetical protein
LPEPWQGLLKAEVNMHYNKGSFRTAQKTVCFHYKELSVLYGETATFLLRDFAEYANALRVQNVNFLVLILAVHVPTTGL